MAESGEKPVTVRDIYNIIDEIAPFSTQEEWDNAGLLAGSFNMPVERVLVALDLTRGVIEEALRVNAELIVTHHPIMFHARKNLVEDDPEGALICALVRSGKALIAAHTNFDVANGGVNCALARAIELSDIQPAGDGLRVGRWEGSFGELCLSVAAKLGGVVRPFGDENRQINSVAVCGGAGSSLWKAAFEAGADAFVTGEIRHNDALDMVSWGLAACEAGHYYTERPSVKALRMGLQKRLFELQYNTMVFDSDYEPF